MSDDAEEIEVYVDPELLTRAKGVRMLETGREPTDDEVVGKALQRMVDAETDAESDDPPLAPERRVFGDDEFALGEVVRDLPANPDLDRFEYQTERHPTDSTEVDR